MKKFGKLFGNKKFYRMVLAIAIPVMVQNAISNFVSLLDNVMVGALGTEQMSGVAIINQLLFIFNLGVFGAVSGISIFSSQFYGRRDWEGMRHSMRAKLIISLLFSAIAITVFAHFGDSLIGLYLQGEEGNCDPAATLAFGKEYIKIMLAGLLPFALSQAYASTLREMGDTKVPMIAGIVAVFTNLSLNWLLIFGKLGFPELGITGAAIATVVSKFIELIIVAAWTHLHSEKYRFIVGVYRSFYVPWPLVKEILKKGSPLFINEILWSVGMATLTQCYSIRGQDVIAGISIASTISNLFGVIYLNLGSSVGLIVGPLLGANEMEEAKDTAVKMITFATIVCLGVGALLYIPAPLFPELFNTTQEVKALAVSLLRVTALCMPMYGFENAAYFTLRTGGKTGITFLFDSGFTWLVVVPLAFVLSRFTVLSIVLLYMCVQLVDLLKCTLGAILVEKGVWINNIVE